MKRFIQGEYRGQSTLFAERILSDTELRGHFQSVFGTSPDGKLDDKSHLLDTMLELEVIRPKSACMIGDQTRRYYRRPSKRITCHWRPLGLRHPHGADSVRCRQASRATGPLAGCNPKRLRCKTYEPDAPSS